MPQAETLIAVVANKPLYSLRRPITPPGRR